MEKLTVLIIDSNAERLIEIERDVEAFWWSLKSASRLPIGPGMAEAQQPITSRIMQGT